MDRGPGSDMDTGVMKFRGFGRIGKLAIFRSSTRVGDKKFETGSGLLTVSTKRRSRVGELGVDTGAVHRGIL